MRITNLVPWNGNRSSLKQMDDSFFAMQEEMDRLFNNFFRGSDGLSLWREMLHPDAISPRINIVEGDTAIEVTAELPGVALEDIDVSLSHDLLTIKGEKRQESEEESQGYHRIERRYGSFCRTITVPADLVNADGLEANLKNGVLTVTLPKREEVQSVAKQIPVKQR